MLRLTSLLMLIELLCALVPTHAAGPKLNHVFPSGGSRGQNVELSVSGSFQHWPVRVWVDEPGVVFDSGSERGKLMAHIAPDALPGVRLIRIYDDEGASLPRPFIVGTLAETLEK